MAELGLVDVSIRDGNQSLWGATGLTTAQVLGIAPVVDRVGFRALDFTSSTHMGVAVRTHRENPWEKIRLTRQAMPNTPLQFIGTGMRFISWETAHPEVMQLVYDRLVASGISRFIVLDPTHDADAMLRSARMLRQAGAGETVAALTYTVSAVHDDAFYGGLAGRLAGSPDLDRFYLKDPAGLLTPERARTLVPAVRARLRGKPLELHSHCNIGLSQLSYLAAAELGVEVLHVACGPLANGSSLPDAQRTVANLRELGHTVAVDERLLARVADYFASLARAESRPAGASGAGSATRSCCSARSCPPRRSTRCSPPRLPRRSEPARHGGTTTRRCSRCWTSCAGCRAGRRFRSCGSRSPACGSSSAAARRAATMVVSALDVLTRRRQARVMVLGTEGLTGPLADAGFEVLPPSGRVGVDAVLVGWYREFTMDALEAACHAVWGGAAFYASSESVFFATAEGKVMATSRAISAMVRSMTGCRVEVVGKPSLQARAPPAAGWARPSASWPSSGTTPS